MFLKTILFLATAGKTSWLVRHNLEFGKNLIVVIPGKIVSVETCLLHYAKELVLVNFAVTIPVSLVNHFLKYMWRVLNHFSLQNIVDQAFCFNITWSLRRGKILPKLEFFP